MQHLFWTQNVCAAKIRCKFVATISKLSGKLLMGNDLNVRFTYELNTVEDQTPINSKSVGFFSPEEQKNIRIFKRFFPSLFLTLLRHYIDLKSAVLDVISKSLFTIQ